MRDDEDDDPAASSASSSEARQAAESIDVKTHYDLGRAYADMGLLADAVEHFQRVLELDPTHADAASSLEGARAQLSTPTTRHSRLS